MKQKSNKTSLLSIIGTALMACAIAYDYHTNELYVNDMITRFGEYKLAFTFIQAIMMTISIILTITVILYGVVRFIGGALLPFKKAFAIVAISYAVQSVLITITNLIVVNGYVIIICKLICIVIMYYAIPKNVVNVTNKDRLYKSVVILLFFLFISGLFI